MPWRIAPMARPCSPGAPTRRRGCGTPPRGQPIGPPLTHQGLVIAVAYSPDGKTVLTGSFDQTARLWNAASGAQIGPALTHPGPVMLRGI